MEEILQAISTVGFPIAVAVYLLVRIEPKLSAMTVCIEKLTSIVEEDSKNTKELDKTLQSFTLGINDLKNEIRNINNKRPN
ncbi:MAG: YvrJ family protein [Methanofastidiosum sp.]|jgi:septal ring factor EnvC (AmiA/AmiB activator)